MEPATRARTVEALEEAQRCGGGYLTQAALRALAAELGVPVYHLYGVATFFPHFRLEAPPALDVRVCTDMSCRLRGGDALLRDVQAASEARPPGTMTVKPVSCLGRCDGAPALTVNDEPYWGLANGRRDAVLASLQLGTPLPPPPAPVGVSGLRADPYAPGEPRYAALRRLVESGDVAGALATLKAAQLRGLGGAGFPAAVKWDAVRNAAGDEKYVVCNADESEPGTIKDRGILTSVPHLLVEGMALAGVIAGARRGIIYIRHEYGPEARILGDAIAAAHAGGVLGAQVLGSSHAFALEISTRAGGVLDGRALKAVAPSGASSGFLPAAMADTPIEWGALQRAGSMVGSSAVVAIADGTCMVDLALNVARFFARESCGKCWPCRVGSEKIVQMLEAASEGRAAEDSLAVLDDLAPTLLLTSICGLGQVVPSPIMSLLRHFPDEVHAHLKERRCPAGTCRMRPA